MKIPFNKPFMGEASLRYIRNAHANKHLSGNGPFSKKCESWLKKYSGCRQALLTHSCTAALEMTAMLLDLKPGEEVIMPSFSFVSTANAFVLRSAVPVFVDIRPDTQNLDETKIEAAITSKTRAIVAMHYAGVSCEMDVLMRIAAKHRLTVIEDAAQAVCCSYKNKPLGSLGTFGALSFHETKTIISGEGGALLVNDSRFIKRSEILREKGTNRSQFFRGEVDKYTWVDIGSSYLPSDLIAAFLWAQLEEGSNILRRRLAIWNNYHAAFKVEAKKGIIQCPMVPSHCRHNGHIYYLLLPNLKQRDFFIKTLAKKGIMATFHYVPLHSSPAGKKFGRSSGKLLNTHSASNRLVRLPLWLGIEEHQQKIISVSLEAIRKL